MSRRSWWRPAVALAAALVLYVALALLDFDPDPVRLPLLVLVCANVALLTFARAAESAKPRSRPLPRVTWNPGPPVICSEPAR